MPAGADLDTYLKFLEINDSVFSDDKSVFLTGSPRRVLQLWRVADGALIGQWESTAEFGRASVLSVALNEEQSVKIIVATNSDGVLEQWDFPVYQ